MRDAGWEMRDARCEMRVVRHGGTIRRAQEPVRGVDIKRPANSRAHASRFPHPASRVLQSRPPTPRDTPVAPRTRRTARSEEHTSELQSLAYLVCRLLLEKKKFDD